MELASKARYFCKFVLLFETSASVLKNLLSFSMEPVQPPCSKHADEQQQQQQQPALRQQARQPQPVNQCVAFENKTQPGVCRTPCIALLRARYVQRSDINCTAVAWLLTTDDYFDSADFRGDDRHLVRGELEGDGLS